jgi:hypothetical protein
MVRKSDQLGRLAGKLCLPSVGAECYERSRCTRAPFLFMPATDGEVLSLTQGKSQGT